MTGKKAGAMAKLNEKVHTANGGLGLWTFHCIIHEEASCCESLKMDNVVEVVVRCVNFICAKGLSHRRFIKLLNKEGVRNGLPYHTEVIWQSRNIVLKRFFSFEGKVRRSFSTERRHVSFGRPSFSYPEVSI